MVGKLWANSLRAKIHQQRDSLTARADQLAADLTGNPDDEAKQDPVQIISEAMVRAIRWLYEVKQTDNRTFLHTMIQAAFRQHTQDLSLADSAKAAEELADALVADRLAHLDTRMRNMDVLSPYWDADPKVAELHDKIMENLRQNARTITRQAAKDIPGALQSAKSIAPALWEQEQMLNTTAEQYRQTMMDRHNQPDFRSPEFGQKHRELNELLTAGIVELLTEDVAQNYPEDQPTFRQLLPDRRHWDTVSRVLPDVPAQRPVRCNPPHAGRPGPGITPTRKQVNRQAECRKR